MCTYQKNEEHKEHKRSEINGSQNSVRFFNLCKVKISQQDAELSKALKRTTQFKPVAVMELKSFPIILKGARKCSVIQASNFKPASSLLQPWKLFRFFIPLIYRFKPLYTGISSGNDSQGESNLDLAPYRFGSRLWIKPTFALIQRNPQTSSHTHFTKLVGI